MVDPKSLLKNRPLVISAALAIVAVFLVNMYLQSQKEQIAQQMEEQSKQVATVFFAKEPIRPGDAVRRDVLATGRMPVRYLQPKAATSLEQIEDRIALVSIERGEYILTTKLMSRGEGANLAQLTPPGKRAVSLVIDSIAGLGGMVRPRDHVDVISIIPVPAIGADGKQVMQATTVTLFQDVLVLAVGGKTETAAILAEGKKAEEKSTPAPASPIVTLALTPEEANIAAFLQEQQVRLRLALRSPSDAQTSPARPPASWDAVLQYLYPGYSPPAPQEQEEPQTIEIRRGTKQEETQAN